MSEEIVLTPEQKKFVDKEKAKLEKAFDEISQKVKARVLKKAELGWHGWDKPSERETIAWKLRGKMQRFISFDETEEKDMLDIIAFASFLIHTNPSKYREE
jgi:hypothetical protein